jgi:SAM-dependent methyltransferase
MYRSDREPTALHGDPPFDAVAAEYDTHFTNNRLGRWLRQAVYSYLAEVLGPGDRVLELGCGTGEDAIWLARRGAEIVATDASVAMLEIASGKARAAGVDAQISFAEFDLLSLGQTAPGGDSASSLIPNPRHPHTQYDAVLANFGVLNCLAERNVLAEMLAQSVRPGGHIVLVLMSPCCPWEIGWHLAHGQLRSAFRRFRAGSEAHVGQGRTVRVWYPSPRRLRQEFGHSFHHVQTVGIGALLPPSYLAHLVDRWPRLFEEIAAWDQRLGRRWPWRWLNDHYLTVFVRR